MKEAPRIPAAAVARDIEQTIRGQVLDMLRRRGAVVGMSGGVDSENFYVSDAAALRGEDSLIDTGLMDPTSVLELIAFLEAEYCIPIDEAEITADNLETVDRIVHFVTRRERFSLVARRAFQFPTLARRA